MPCCDSIAIYWYFQTIVSNESQLNHPLNDYIHHELWIFAAKSKLQTVRYRYLYEAMPVQVWHREMLHDATYHHTESLQHSSFVGIMLVILPPNRLHSVE